LSKAGGRHGIALLANDPYNLVVKILLILLVVLALVFGGYWFVSDTAHRRAARQAEEQAAHRAEQMGSAIKDKVKDWSLSTPDIKQELERTGKVVRKKAEQVGHAIADATADTRITAAIKAKFVQDPAISALRISVNTTGGVVTLSGSVDSPEEIKEAMKLALETDGVSEVISTLQVRAPK
jgi:hyperosmotically inducible protein